MDDDVAFELKLIRTLIKENWETFVKLLAVMSEISDTLGEIALSQKSGGPED